MFECSSSIEEMQERQKRLQYRKDWLEALLAETQRELESITPPEELAKIEQAESQQGKIPEYEVFEFLNRMAQVLLESIKKTWTTPEEIRERRQELLYHRKVFCSLLDETQRELDVLPEIIKKSVQEQGAQAEEPQLSETKS